MSANLKLRLRQSVGIVSNDGLVDFFKANVRDILKIKMNFDDIINLLKFFNGSRTIDEVCRDYNIGHNKISLSQLLELSTLLHKEYILIQQNSPYPENIIKKNYRLINLLEDYCHSTQEVLNAFNKLNQSKVMIIGLGAVGSFVATYLAKSYVGHLILVDGDIVDGSNLHRQYYFENQINYSKVDSLVDELKNINSNIKIDMYKDNLDSEFFQKNEFSNLDLIINCADEPSVDFTSRIIAKYSMENKIPHIVGGGYNLHLTLIGQTIIPFHTACFQCFQIFLEDMNNSALINVKKLHRENRKLGSFPPLSGMAASLAALDAFKVLIGHYDTLQQANKRIEFNLKLHQFNSMTVEKQKDCTWCGELNG